MTGPELRAARFAISRAIGDDLSFLDMAALCGLSDPAGNGKDTIRKWESGDGPSGPVAGLVCLILDGLNSDATEVHQFAAAAIRSRVGIID